MHSTPIAYKIATCRNRFTATRYLLFSGILLLVSCQSNLPYQQNQGEIFKTSYSIKYQYIKSLQDEIEDKLHRFDLSLNPFNPQSIISKINNNEPVVPDSFFLNLLHRSMEISHKTDGKFDITVSPFINAWGFGFNNMENVTQAMIDSLKLFVGYDKISVTPDGNIVKADPRLQLNASAIAKGYACDVVGNLLESYGIKNYLVEIGGEIVAKGVNKERACWRIGIDKPIDDISGTQHELQTRLSLCNKALATSGNYRNYYVKDGKKYAHTIDPDTGYPAETDILSATVIADDCMTADAYATAFMTMGMEESIATANKLPGISYYFIYHKPDDTYGIIYSEGFERFMMDAR